MENKKAQIAIILIIIVLIIIGFFLIKLTLKQKPTPWQPTKDYYIIDSHAHLIIYNENQGLEDTAKIFVEEMDKYGIDKALLLSVTEATVRETGSFELARKQNDDVFAASELYPKRFDVFVGLDYEGFNNPNWGSNAVKKLDNQITEGAKGVKSHIGNARNIVGLNKALNLPTTHSFMSDKKLVPVFDELAKLNAPFLVHVSIVEDWKEENKPINKALVNDFEKLVAAQPNTKFILAHLGQHSIEKMTELFDKYPNLYVDSSGLKKYVRTKGDADKTRAFLIKYQDRILFGTDYWPYRGGENTEGTWPEREKYRPYGTYRQILEGDLGKLFIDNAGDKLYSIGLPENVLQKIYHVNSEKVFG